MLVFDHNAEARLTETLGEMREARAGWTVVMFHLAQLRREYKNEYQLNIALNLVKDLLREDDGAIYLFADGSLTVLCNNLHAALLHKLVFQLRYLYMDDPLAYTPDGAENAAFCTVYPLSERWMECMRDATRHMTRAAREEEIAERKALPAPATFGVTELAEVERSLQQSDVLLALRRQPVCVVTGANEFRRVFDELYISLAHLRELLHAPVDLLSNRWLFKYIARQLDDRVLTRLQTHFAEYLSHPVSINVNAETLLSEHFQAFDAALTPALKVAIVFEIQAMDVFADMAGFFYARDRVQKQGYRVCIDGLTSDSFLHLDRARLGADLMKLQWNADNAEDLRHPSNRALADAIAACGNTRVILCRCDDAQAVEYGRTLGISLFQGRYLDSVLSPHAELRN